MRVATWTNGKSTVTGRWEYFWQSDRFVVELDRKDRITGAGRRFTVEGYMERPEWGNWKLVEAKP